MNEFRISGKVDYIAKEDKGFGRGLNITHYPETPTDCFFSFSVLIDDLLMYQYDIQMFDYIELSGHFITLGSDKKKQLRLVDEVMKVVHE